MENDWSPNYSNSEPQWSQDFNYYQGLPKQEWLVKPGDLLFAWAGVKGVSFGPTIWKGPLGVLNQHIYRIHPMAGVNKSWLYYALAQVTFDIEKKAHGFKTSLVHVRKSDITNASVANPSSEGQAAIADLLSTWDDAIEKIDRLIAAKEKQLAALKQDLLTGNRRIKGFKDSWREYRLSDVLAEHGKLSSGKEEVFSVSVHKGLVNQVEHLGRSFAAKDTSNYNLVKPGDIVYTRSPTGNFPYGIIKQSRVHVAVIVSPLYGVFTPRDHALGTFLDFYFESPVRTKNYLAPIIQKGAKNTINITNATFLSNKLYLPTCNEETKAIADTLNTIRQEIDLLKQQADALRRQKRGLMQKLLTGVWRVKIQLEVRA